MAKYKSSLKRKDAFFLDFDAQKLANAIEAAGGNIKPAIEQAARRSLPIIQKEFQAFAREHHVTGDTERSLIDPSQVTFIWGKNAKKRFVGSTTAGVKGFTGGSVKVVSEEDCLYFEYGFDAKKGGLPALFLDIGTPKIKPTFFIYYAVERNLARIHQIQREELTKILEGLKK